MTDFLSQTLLVLLGGLSTLTVGLLAALARWIWTVDRKVVAVEQTLFSTGEIERSNAAAVRELTNAMSTFIEKHKTHDAFQMQQQHTNETLYRRIETSAEQTSLVLQAMKGQQQDVVHLTRSMDSLLRKVDDLDHKFDEWRLGERKD